MPTQTTQQQAARRAARLERLAWQRENTDLVCRQLTPEEIAALPARGSAPMPGALAGDRLSWR